MSVATSSLSLVSSRVRILHRSNRAAVKDLISISDSAIVITKVTQVSSIERNVAKESHFRHHSQGKGVPQL